MATNFFENQAQARSVTNRLIFFYICAVIAIVTSIWFLAHIILNLYSDPKYPVNYIWPTIAGAGALITIFIGMMVRSIQLSGGGDSVALLLGGTPLNPDSKEPEERKLLNVVEEMSIASGVPVPRVYVLEDHNINAFAAGIRPNEAVIGVTRGTINHLSRDELQGVIAHEFSHIFNGDMRMNVRLMGVLGGILAISTMGRLVVEIMGRSRPRRSNSKGGNGLVYIYLFGFGLMIIGYAGVFFARLIKAAVSRQREFLADASAVQYTRNPGGIGGALKKIMVGVPTPELTGNNKEDFRPGLDKNPYAEEASHFFFGSLKSLSGMFATHPPLDERINKIDPNILKTGNRVQALKTQSTPRKDTSGVSMFASATSSELVESIGHTTPESIEAANKLLNSVPDSLREAARTPEAAKAVILSMLLNENSRAPQAQNAIKASLGEYTLKNALYFGSQELPKSARLPLLELCFPAIRNLEEAEKPAFAALLRDISRSDARFVGFEFVTTAMVNSILKTGPRRRVGSRSLGSLQSEASILISAIVHAGVTNKSEALKAFRLIQPKLSSFGVQVTLFDSSRCTPDHLEIAVSRLRDLKPMDLEKLIEACGHIILDDRKITEDEASLLKGVCALLEVPVPLI